MVDSLKQHISTSLVQEVLKILRIILIEVIKNPPVLFLNKQKLRSFFSSTFLAVDQKCQFNRQKVSAKIKSWKYVKFVTTHSSFLSDLQIQATKSYDETTLRQNLVGISPLSICVDAANWQGTFLSFSFNFFLTLHVLDYSSGVMTAWECAWIVQLDHCVQLIGYDLTASTPFYYVRNSWGTDWGSDGYILLEANANTCGLTEEGMFFYFSKRDKRLIIFNSFQPLLLLFKS